MATKAPIPHEELEKVNLGTFLQYVSGICPCETPSPGVAGFHSKGYTIVYRGFVAALVGTATIITFITLVTTTIDIASLTNNIINFIAMSSTTTFFVLWIRNISEINQLIRDSSKLFDEMMQNANEEQVVLLLRSRRNEKLVHQANVVAMAFMAFSAVGYATYTVLASGENIQMPIKLPEFFDLENPLIFHFMFIYGSMSVFAVVIVISGQIAVHLCYNVRNIYLFKYLKISFREMLPTARRQLQKMPYAHKRIQDTMDDVLALLLRQHQELLRLTNENNRIFAAHLGMRLGDTFVLLALCVYVLSSNSSEPKFAAIAFFMVTHMLLIGVTSDILRHTSMGVCESVWLSDWLLLNRASQLKLKLLILCSQKPIYISASGFFGYFTIHTFVQVIRTSFSIWQALRSLH